MTDLKLPATSPFVDRLTAAFKAQDCRDPLFAILHDYATAAVLAERAKLAKVMAFVGDIVPDDYNEWGDIDGFHLEEMLLQHGLLVRERREVPCGEVCACAGEADDNVVDCNRFTPLLSACFRAADEARQQARENDDAR